MNYAKPEATVKSDELRLKGMQFRAQDIQQAQEKFDSVVTEHKSQIEEARQELENDAKDAAVKLRAVMNCGSDLEESESRALKLQMDAAKHILKLNGMEVVKIAGHDGGALGVIVLPPVLEE